MKKDYSHGYSTLTEMYSSWMQYDIPVTFYHYFLTILKSKGKQQQQSLMNKQISSLKAGTHLYLQIKSSIQARQNSLSIIKTNLPILKNKQVISKPLNNIHQDKQILGYKKLFQTIQKIQQRTQNRQLRELSNHLVIYRKITLQIIFLIHKWMTQVVFFGYEGLAQFLYQNDDYLQQINEKTLTLLEEYSDIFEFNPFFILKKDLAKGQYELVYEFLKITPQLAKNLYEALKLLSEHHTNNLKVKMLGKGTFMANKRKITKSNSVHKLYGNLLNGKQYYMVKDTYLKSQRLLSDHVTKYQNENLIKNKSALETIETLKSKISSTNRLKHLDHPSILVNPQVMPKTNFIERKYPTFFSDNTENQGRKRKSKDNFATFLLKNNYKTQVGTINHKKSLILQNPMDNFEIYKNKGLQLQYQMNLINKFDKEKTYQKAHQEKNKATYNQSVFSLKDILQNSSMIQSQPVNQSRNKQQKVEQSFLESTLPHQLDSIPQKVQIQIEKNIQPTHVLKYLKQIFKFQIKNQNNLNKMTSEKLQSLTKFVLSNRQYISIYKIGSQNSLIKKQDSQTIIKKPKQNLLAWMICKLQKSQSTLQKTVNLLFLYQFKSYSNLNSLIINYFKQLGYYNLKQNGKIVSQVPPNNIQETSNQIIRCKYKVSPKATNQDIKQLIKNTMCLKMSRLLKYHYYSKTSKYHKYCQHKSKQMTCSIGYYFEEVSKIFINNKSYIKAKIDSIQRIKECYKIYHHLNKTFLILATTIQDIKQFEKQTQKHISNELDNDSSFDEQISKSNQYNFVCFQEGKFMRKYVNQRQKPLINQFVWIQSNIPQIRSISVDKKDITGSDCLVLSQPYILAIYSKDQEQGYKSLAVLDFSQ